MHTYSNLLTHWFHSFWFFTGISLIISRGRCTITLPILYKLQWWMTKHFYSHSSMLTHSWLAQKFSTFLCHWFVTGLFTERYRCWVWWVHGTFSRWNLLLKIPLFVKIVNSDNHGQTLLRHIKIIIIFFLVVNFLPLWKVASPSPFFNVAKCNIVSGWGGQL